MGKYDLLMKQKHLYKGKYISSQHFPLYSRAKTLSQ
ncbi:hypothetical protein Bcell_2164 [Evansella cellulosilytica DSM 2522]|uniref:Uncharacterized protein n=1 Tax=Evansella cellulosilytica (strain ATCC 21833 / DSM 2522 / FERM P-1141 / JCM 9156 / N-4) TaxID=649639 RepID=E6U247_EVAC2|nr:hypothetical protein Bcell_2164 [Evansella cellulosilytica DSM 2522]